MEQGWVQLVSSVGFPIALILIILGATGIGLWKGLPWMAEKVITPITLAHLKLVETLDKSIQSQAESQKMQAESMVRMAKSMEQIEGFVTRHHAFAEEAVEDAELGKFCKAKDRQSPS